MESWMISLGIAIVGFISSLAVLKSKMSDREAYDVKQDNEIAMTAKVSEDKDRRQDDWIKQLESRINFQREEIAVAKNNISSLTHNKVGLKEVRAEFVSRDIFLLFEKHINEKFADIKEDQKTIIKMLKEITK